MSGKFAKLKTDCLLRGWLDTPFVVANRTRGGVLQLDKKGFYVAEACDGETNFNSFAFLPEHHALLDTLIKEGVAELCQEGEHIESYQRYRKATNPRLTEIHWCVTGHCNLNCRHCYMESPSGRYGELPFKDMVRLIEQFERANVLQISLTGGEPFLRHDILDIIALIAEKNIRLSQIYSNGLLITKEHLEAIRRIGVLPSFQISFDGVGYHDYMRGTKGIESGVIEAIRAVRSAGFPTVVATSVDKMSISRLTDTYELIKGLGVKAWNIASPQETGNWRGSTTALSLNQEAEAYMPLIDRWSRDGKPFFIQLAGFFRGSETLGDGSLTDGMVGGNVMPAYTLESYDCEACREGPNLLPDGTIIPCPAYVDSIIQDQMPNLLREDLSTVWTKSIMREVADMKKKDLLSRNPECAVCEMFTECGLGCRALALTKTGDLMAKDPISCELWKHGHKKRFAELAVSGQID